MAIEAIDTGNGRLRQFGIRAIDYVRNDEQVDLQDLLTDITVGRANAIEAEITPLANLMRRRNTRLDQYGSLLAKLNKIEVSFKDDDEGATVLTTDSLSTQEARLLNELGFASVHVGTFPSKAETQQYIQAVRSEIDGLNNRSQNDTTRLQSLVQNRDLSFTKAAELLKDMVDSRSKTTAALGG